MTRTCPECQTELVDENQGRYRLQFDHPHDVCPNRHCPKSPDYKPTCPVCDTELVDDVCPACTERNEEILKIVLGDEPYQEPENDLEACYQNVTARYL